MKRIVVDTDYHHGSNDDARGYLTPGLRANLAHRIGDRKTVRRKALISARKELQHAVDELDELIRKEEEKS